MPPEPTERDNFYDEHPFDWVSAEGSGSMRAVVSPALADWIEKLDTGKLVIDVGCGPGRVLRFLARRGVRCVGIDRSRVSMRLAMERCQRPGVVGDNLLLPFADVTADAVISDGVIHHTGDARAAFIENCRILKPGGRMYLAVYKPSGHYPFLYRYPGALIRSGLRRGWAKPLVTLFAQVPYFLVHFVRSGGRRTWAGARNLFYDYFVTPRVAFLPRQIVEEWCVAAGMRVVAYDESRGSNVHSFCLTKAEPATTTCDSDTASAAAAAITSNSSER